MTAAAPSSLPASGPLDGVFAAAVTTGVSAGHLGLGFGDTLTSCLTVAVEQAASAGSSSTPVAGADQDERTALVAGPGALLAAVAAVATASALEGDAAPPRAAVVDHVATGVRPTEHDGSSDTTDVAAAQPAAAQHAAGTAVEGAPPPLPPAPSPRNEVDAIAGQPAGADDPPAADAQAATTVTTNERAAAAPPSHEPQPARGVGGTTDPPGPGNPATPTGVTDPQVSGPSGPSAPSAPTDQSGPVAPSVPSDRSGAVAPPESSRRPAAGASAASGSAQPVAGPDGTASADITATAAPTATERGSDVVAPPGIETRMPSLARSAVESGAPADTGAAAEPTAQRPGAATTDAAATDADAAASAITRAPTSRHMSSRPSVPAAPEATGTGGDGADAVGQPLLSALSSGPPEPASGERPAPPSAAASRILELVERLRHEPPPRQMVVDLASFGVGRLVVSLRGDTVVVGPAQADAALDPQWLRDLGQALDARGWSLDERGGQPSHGRGRRPMPRWDLPHRIDRAGVDDALRL